MATAVLGCLLGAALVLLAAGRPWVHAVALQEPVRVPLSVKGGSLSPAVPSAGLVCLAGVVGVLAARSVVRRLVGALIALAGLGAAVASVIEANPGAGELSGRAGEAVGTASATATAVDATLWPWVAVLGALLAAAAGALTALRSGSWPGMSSRYERPDGAPARTAAPSSDAALEQWRALDRGEDPTL
jgi:uncharacterized membrane protein (TIGR02234 family)